MPSCYSKTNVKRRRRVRINSLRGTYRYVRWRWRLLFALTDALGRLLFWPAKLLLQQRQHIPLDACNVQRILLVQLDHLGDAVITLRTLHRLQRRFPFAAIDVLCSPWTAELFDASDDVSRVFVSHNNRFCRQRRKSWWLSTIRWGLRLRLRRYDVAFDVRGEAPLAALLWLTGARYRVGWNCGGGGFLLTHSPAFVRGRSEFDSREALWVTLGVQDETWPTEVLGDEASSASLADRLNIDAVARRNVDRRLSSLQPDSSPRIVLHLGAGTAAKRWPVERWRLLIEQLSATVQGTLIIVGTHNEQPLASTVTANQETSGVANWTGELGIIELAYLLNQADLFIGADSGPAHLAAAMQTPTVVLFSGTNDAGQWRPLGEHVRVLSRPVACSPCHRSQCAWSDHPCMRGITPAGVLAMATELLSTRNNGFLAQPSLLEDEPLPVELLEAPGKQI